MKGSFIVLLFFFLGVLAGHHFQLGGGWHDYSLWALFALMFQVGISVGCNDNLSEMLRYFRPKMMLIPVATLLGTVLFSGLASIIISNRSIADVVAVGSGMGYYSLSSILITQLKAESIGAEAAAQLGTIALMANIVREMVALILAPRLNQWFGPLAPICAAGVTSVDVCLPSIVRASGAQFIPVALFHGMVLDLCIPLWMPFVCSF